MELKTILFFSEQTVNNIICQLLNNLEMLEIQSLWNPESLPETAFSPESTLIVAETAQGIQFAIKQRIPYIEKWENTLSDSQWKPVCYYDRLEALTCEYLENQWKRAHHLPLTICTSKRFYLQELSLADFPKLYAIRQKEAITRFLPKLSSLEEELKKHKHYITCQYEFFDYGLWGVFKKDGTLIGQAGIQNTDYNGHTYLELAYFISPEYQQKGYATEAILAIYHFVVTHLEENRILAIIAKNNLASIRTAMNLGMKPKEEVKHLGFDCHYYVLDNIKDFLSLYESEQKRVNAAKSALRNAIKRPVQEVYSRYRQ
ncbi:Protein N-acetyltransferase, RimJ/RimL family [[Clostridium] polysaccharolyticum]|uniref:Protein N-acetyltransferase, RimJ/RimL family n=2 Tax=[Clostridium] polysaccharolyticum TaxID=29364 RepID=A0A1I0DXM1_9FIRM|nr:Protein N-acetyltransferase, RimJ/RimL family [[Clostridium] polysaccharolyticum]